MKPRSKIALKGAKPILRFKRSVLQPTGTCAVCGTEAEWHFATVINNELAETWALDEVMRNSFDARESMFCPSCGCSFRLRLLAECLTYLYGAVNLQELVKKKDFKQLKVVEINSCGKLHETLRKLPNLKYSEYGSKDKDIPSENLEKLSYVDNAFDLVLTSDTLEHVPNIEKALKEIHRILKPGGKHIFTVPVVWSRKTNKRAELTKRKLIHKQPPSYHGAGEPDYLVFYEFGHDIIDILDRCGFKVQVYKVNLVNLNDVSGVIIATKVSENRG